MLNEVVSGVFDEAIADLRKSSKKAVSQSRSGHLGQRSPGHPPVVEAARSGVFGA